MVFFGIIAFFMQTACGPLKYKKVSAKDFPPDPKERVKKNIEEGRGFRVMGNLSTGTNYEFASSNPLWRATLETLDFMPLVSANYSGGIIITDWYNDASSSGQSVKISVRFLTNEVRSDALDVKIFTKNCDTTVDCKITEDKGTLVLEITKSILKKAAIYKKQNKEKNKVKYENSALD